jgi:NAD(P)H dehydrogenase (quinone)
MSIVVTGATGQLGRLVIDELLGRVPADQVAAVVRNPYKAADMAARGVELRIADYNEPQTLKEAFRAGDKVLLISGNEIGRRTAQHTAVIDAAKEAGVALLAYTSVLGGPKATFAIAEEHKATERVILDSGLPYVLLRNGWYNENYTEQLAVALEHGVTQAAGEGRVASAARADYAGAAVAVLTGEGHENTTYELSGDTNWGFAEYAAEVSKQSGKDVAYNAVPVDVFTGILVGVGLPEGFAGILAGVDASIEQGELAGTPGDLSRLTGRPTTPIAESIAAALKA